MVFSKFTVSEDQFDEINSQDNASDSLRKLKEIRDAKYSEYGDTMTLNLWLDPEKNGNQFIHVNRIEEDQTLVFALGTNVIIVITDPKPSYNYAVYDNATFTIQAVLSEPEKYWRLTNKK